MKFLIHQSEFGFFIYFLKETYYAYFQVRNIFGGCCLKRFRCFSAQKGISFLSVWHSVSAPKVSLRSASWTPSLLWLVSLHTPEPTSLTMSPDGPVLFPASSYLHFYSEFEQMCDMMIVSGAVFPGGEKSSCWLLAFKLSRCSECTRTDVKMCKKQIITIALP